jgi:hypothetical protein
MSKRRLMDEKSVIECTLGLEIKSSEGYDRILDLTYMEKEVPPQWLFSKPFQFSRIKVQRTA